MTLKSAQAQVINRLRNKAAGYGRYTNAKCLSKIEIPLALHSTYKDEKFYWDDTGNDDPNRIIIFTTEKNLSLPVS